MAGIKIQPRIYTIIMMELFCILRVGAMKEQNCECFLMHLVNKTQLNYSLKTKAANALLPGPILFHIYFFYPSFMPNMF